MTQSRIVEVAELDFRLTSYDWPFRRERAAEIRAHWEKLRKGQPSLFNGSVLLMRRHAFETRAGATVLAGEYFETDYASFLAWRDFGFPDPAICNGFSMAALLASDGAYLLGEMAAHTANAGAIYFAGGTPDRNDVFGETVDLTASVTRELEEETGIAARETSYDAHWIVVDTPPRLACLKIMRLGETAEVVKARIEAFLALDPKPELARMHIARRLEDVDRARMPQFTLDFLTWALAQRSTG